jgi:hypothetical protein
VKDLAPKKPLNGLGKLLRNGKRNMVSCNRKAPHNGGLLYNLNKKEVMRMNNKDNSIVDKEGQERILHYAKRLADYIGNAINSKEIKKGGMIDIAHSDFMAEWYFLQSLKQKDPNK